MPLTDSQKSILESTVKSCLAEAKDPKESTAISKFMFCAMKELANACPKDLQDPSETCNDLRAGKMLAKPDQTDP